jgi:peptidoglycan/LPS O-acetylase OafA/YrhL
MEPADYLQDVHMFRAVAIVAVVGTHLDLDWPPGFASRMAESLITNGTVLFIFIAGLLFQHRSRTFAYLNYLKTKLLNVIVPYFVSSMPALVYQYVRHLGIYSPHAHHMFRNPIATAALALLTAAHMRVPFWFVPMIAIFYLLAPLLLAIDRRPRFYWILPVATVVAMFAHRPSDLGDIGHAAVYFVPAYLFGMWFSHYRTTLMARLRPHILLLFAAFVALLIFDTTVLGRAGAIHSATLFSTENGVIGLNLPIKMLESVILLLALERYAPIIGHRLDYLAAASFGVFFVHKYVLDGLQRLMLHFNAHDPSATFLRVVLLISIATLLSLAIIALIRWIAGRRSRYIIGC